MRFVDFLPGSSRRSKRASIAMGQTDAADRSVSRPKTMARALITAKSFHSRYRYLTRPSASDRLIADHRGALNLVLAVLILFVGIYTLYRSAGSLGAWGERP
jgi:hypothetical protein